MTEVKAEPRGLGKVGASFTLVQGDTKLSAMSIASAINLRNQLDTLLRDHASLLHYDEPHMAVRILARIRR